MLPDRVRAVIKLEPAITAVAFSPDGRWLCIGDASCKATIVEASPFFEFPRISAFQLPGGAIVRIAFGHERIACSTCNKVLYEVDLLTGHIREIARGHLDFSYSVATGVLKVFNVGEEGWAGTSSGFGSHCSYTQGRLRFTLDTGETTELESSGLITGAAVCAANEIVVTTKDRRISYYRLVDSKLELAGRVSDSIGNGGWDAAGLVHLDCGKRILWGYAAGTLSLWSLEQPSRDFSPLSLISNGPGSVSCAAACVTQAGGVLVALGGTNKTLYAAVGARVQDWTMLVPGGRILNIGPENIVYREAEDEFDLKPGPVHHAPRTLDLAPAGRQWPSQGWDV